MQTKFDLFSNMFFFCFSSSPLCHALLPMTFLLCCYNYWRLKLICIITERMLCLRKPESRLFIVFPNYWKCAITLNSVLFIFKAVEKNNNNSILALTLILALLKDKMRNVEQCNGHFFLSLVNKVKVLIKYLKSSPYSSSSDVYSRSCHSKPMFWIMLMCKQL